MKPLTILNLTYSLIIGLFLSSCAAGPRNPQVAQARQQFQSRKTYAQGIIGGAILGAAIGTLNGLQVGPGGTSFDRRRAGTGALVGAGVGAVGGGVVKGERGRLCE